MDRLSCQGAEQTLGGSPSVLCGGWLLFHIPVSFVDRFGTFALPIGLDFSEKVFGRIWFGFRVIETICCDVGALR